MRLALLALVVACGHAERQVVPITKVVVPPPADAAPPPPDGMAQLTSALLDLGLQREVIPDAGFETSGCTTPETKVQVQGRTITIRDAVCFTCRFDVAPIDKSADETLAAFALALRATPASFLRIATTTRVALCTKLTLVRPSNGVGSDDIIGGTVDFIRGALVLSLETSSILTGDEIVHHELFHLLERKAMLDEAASDPAWLALNPEDFQYGGDQTLRTGFLNQHAMKSHKEDKATTYQFMMARPKELCAAAAVDPIILAKARLIRTRIRKVIGDADAAIIDQRDGCLTAP